MSIEAYYQALPEPQSTIFLALREIMLGAHPAMTEGIGWNTPVFHIKSLVCYVSFERKKKCCYIGFANGKLLQDPSGILETQNHKYAGIVWVPSLERLEQLAEDLEGIIQQAVLLQLQKKK